MELIPCWMVLSGSTASWMKPCSCCLEARRMKRPMGRPV